MGLSVALVPQYLSAKTPQGLQRLMLLNNIRRGAFIRYQDIQFVNGRWVCWFYTSDVLAEDLLAAQTNSSSEKGGE